jgi:glycosyltransferase involved in cell wall biosynthesis
MLVAIITDLPFLCTDTMYLDELEKRLPMIGINPKVFLVNSSKIFEKIDTKTGIIKLLTLPKLLKILSNFDIIHIQFTFPLGLGLTFLSSLRLLNKPIIIHTHGYDVFTVPSVNYGLRRNEIGRYLAHLAWKKANRIIAVCEQAKNEIEKDGIRANKIDLLYNGIDESLFHKTEIKEELLSLRQDSDIIFLSVASMTPVKNHVGLLRTFSKIIEKYGSKYRIKLVLIGGKTNSYQPMVEHPNVVYLDKKNHSDLKYYYSISDAFVLPSLSEAHPWSVLEAMSCELPVIASNVGGIPETLVDSRFLMNPLDIEDIFKKFEFILAMDKMEREKIGRTNRETVLERYTINRHVDSLKKIYESVLTE